MLQWVPGRGQSLAILYEIRKAQGKSATSVALIRCLGALAPNNLWATNELTLLLLGRGNVPDAECRARNAARLGPENAQSHYLKPRKSTTDSCNAWKEKLAGAQ
jgi:hypothetical protein